MTYSSWDTVLQHALAVIFSNLLFCNKHDDSRFLVLVSFVVCHDHVTRQECLPSLGSELTVETVGYPFG